MTESEKCIAQIKYLSYTS